MSESDLQVQVADYLRLRYPDVLFHSDFGSGVRLTPGQAVEQKRVNGGRRGWPDMFIAEPMTNDGVGHQDKNGDNVGRGERVPLTDVMESWVAEHAYNSACGLFLELKKEGETLYPGSRAKNRYKSKDGKEYKTEHLMEQADYLYELRERGYCAEFAIGFDEAKRIIDEYLGQ